MKWQPDAWQEQPCQQAIQYTDNRVLTDVLHHLSKAPPLVSVNSITNLKQSLLQVSAGQAFIIHAGDCAEHFNECDAENVKRKLALMQKIQHLLEANLNLPIIPIGRIAGQHAKPRTHLFEQRHGEALPNYRGDMINDVNFTSAARTADPQRLHRSYECAAQTLQYIKNHWQDTPFFISHEALNLHYEQALTRKVDEQWYNLSTHLPWIGIRTNKPTSAHVNYFQGIANPVAVKIGPQTPINQVVELVQRLNPDRQSNRLVLIHRFGNCNVADYLPQVFSAVRDTNIPVLWQCDPLHGNTKKTPSGIKVRFIDDILAEISTAIAIHKKMDTPLHGLHLEWTPDTVTECIRQQAPIDEQALRQAYRSQVDPRLNAEQATEVSQHFCQAFLTEKQAKLNQSENVEN